MKRFNIIVKVLMVALLMTIASAILSVIQADVRNLPVYLWLFLSNLLIASVLTYFVLNSVYWGWKLSLATFLLYFAISIFNTQIEAIIFNVLEPSVSIRYMVSGAVIALITSYLLVLINDKWKQDDQMKSTPFNRSILSWIWRILVADILYLLFYFIAGITLQLIYPQFMDFYQGKIPSILLIIKTQIFLRGFVFIGIAMLIIRATNLSAARKGILIGSVFAIFGAIAPLLIPNEFMPFNVRVAHGFETSISNFLYGFLLSYLFRESGKNLSLKMET